MALGALAAGNPEPAEILLEGELPTPWHLLAAARHAAWSGTAGLLRHRRAVDQATERLLASLPRGGSVGASDRVAALAALTELANAWEAFGERAHAGTLRARTPPLGDALTAADTGRPGGIRLPMLSGGPPRRDPAAALTAAALGVGNEVYREPPEEPPGGERALRAWALFRAGDPDRAGVHLHDHVARGFQAGAGLWSVDLDGSSEAPSSGASSHQPPRSCSDHGASAALVPAALLFGALGASADAPLGRLRLAPRPPASWRSLTVTAVRVGEARVDLSYARNGAEHAFEVEQVSGRIPLMLVFQPEVAEPFLREVQIGGALADVDRSAGSGRAGVSVQLPLDQKRRIVLIGG